MPTTKPPKLETAPHSSVLWGLKKDIAIQRFVVIQARIKNNRSKINTWARGRKGGIPPLRVKNPAPTLRPKIGYLKRKFLILPPSMAKKQTFLTKFYLKKCPNGAKRCKNFCVFLNCVENFILPPPQPPPPPPNPPFLGWLKFF